MAFSLLWEMYSEYFSVSLARQVLLGILESLSEASVALTSRIIISLLVFPLKMLEALLSALPGA